MSSNFSLYHLTLQPPTGISSAVVGNFSAANKHELVVARGNYLEVLSRDTTSSLLRVIHREPCFGSVRNVGSIRISGQSRDLLVVTSDSGRLSFLKFTGTAFERLFCESYGKTGIRRVVPGEYMATDPAGRAVMIAAIEKDKFVFGTNRDSDDQLYVASPLEAHKFGSITFALVGLDVGYDNPIFAALETIYDDDDEGKKFLVLYEVDLGLNHVVRKWSKQVTPSANHLVAVPNAGVIVCSADGLEYVKQNEPSITLALPRREWDDPSRDTIVIASTTFQSKDVFFALVQTERGDLFKLSLETQSGKVSALVLKYFDSVAPANHLCLSKDGSLFIASEFGDHELYEVAAVGDLPNDKSVEVRSASGNGKTSTLTFVPRNEPINLVLFDVRPSLCPIVSLRASDLAKDGGVAQLYTLCGRAEKSSIRTLRQGLSVMDAGNIRFAAGKAEMNRGVWTVRHALTGAERFIVISQKDSTRIFSIKTEKAKPNSDEPDKDVIAEDTTTTSVVRTAATLCAGGWGQGAELIQVTSTGWRRINYDTNQVVSEYKVQGQKRVEVACCTSRQICLVLAGGEVIYFEADGGHQPVERAKMDQGIDIACVDCDAAFLVLGCWDSVVRVFSVNNLAALSSQKVPSKPSSVCLVRDESRGRVRLEIGLQSGLLVRSVLDMGSSGAIVDSRTHVLGSKPVKIQRVLLNVTENGLPETVTMCCSTRVWLARPVGTPTPLSFRPFEFAAPFKASVFNGQEGMVVLGPGSVLSVATLDGYGLDPSKKFTEEVHKLDRTPRRLVFHPVRNDVVIVIEGDRDSFASAVTSSSSSSNHGQALKQKTDDDMDVDEEEEDTAAGASSKSDVAEKDPSFERGKVVGHGRQADPDGSWASCVRVMSPFTGQTLQRIQLDSNEMAVSLERGRFGGDDYLFVGTVHGMRFHPRREVQSCTIRTYKFLPTGGKVEFVHSTKTDDVPFALASFDDRLVCGSGQALTLYELGHKQLLRKAEMRNLPSMVAFIKPVSSERLIVGDSSESVYFVHYDKQENSFSSFADDSASRMCLAGEVLDPNTCAASDKFGSVFVVRLPPGATGQDPRSRAAHTRNALWDQASSAGAPHKLDLLAHFYVGQVVTALQKCTLAPGRTETLLYGTILGAVGTFSPFSSRDDLDFFSLLEIHLRKHYKNVLGREHLQYRSYYSPCKSVVDGDLCEVFLRLPDDLKNKVAKEMDRSVEDVSRRIEEMRGSVQW